MHLLTLPCLYLLVFFSYVYAGDDLSTLIDQVFSNPSKQPQQNEGQVNVNPECSCVPFNLCKNNSVNTNGVGLIDIRLKDGPCDNYLQVCCNDPIDRVPPPPVVRSGCGRHNADGVGFRITGDEHNEAQFGEFPWMVAILREDVIQNAVINVFQCGGALIHPQVVLTGAHCVDRKAKFKVRAGEWDTQTNDELFPHQDSEVDSIVIHPHYHSGSLQNDIALLFLKSAITLADNIDVICLPRQDERIDFGTCYASGWGKDVFGKEGEYQVIMKKVELPVVPKLKCQESLRLTRLGPHFKLHDSFMCAGGEPGKDTCKGDGGSPLACPVGNTGKFAQAGIVSWGIGCGEKGTPGVYADVAKFRNWMDSQLQAKNLDSRYYQY